MNHSTNHPNRKYFRHNSRQTCTGFLMYAFKLPSNNPALSLPRSKWSGNPVCQPRIVFTSQNFRVTTLRRTLQTVSQIKDDTDLQISHPDLARSFPDTQEDISSSQALTLPKSMSIWLFIAENAVQLTILALAIAGSIHARRYVLVRLLALLSVPQLVLVVNRIYRQIRSPVPPNLVSTDSSVLVDDRTLTSTNEDRVSVSKNQDEAPVSEPVPSRVAKEDQKGELSLAQSKIISTGIRNAVAEEVGSLRYAIEQIEQKTEERQQARNLVIAEAIASLDGSLRSLRRSIDTRHQVEKSAPFALVSELEIVKSRLKQAEQEKMELEVRLRAAEDNFEEAKRQGERARREADDASSKELSLRTELTVASSRLLRLEEVTERLDKAERRNDELQEKLINGTREQEGLRQSAEDAARRVVRVENVAKILREKIQELSGKSLSRYVQEGGDLFGAAKEKSEDQFWPQLLRNKGDLRQDSVVYQELLREEKESQSPHWPRDPLGIEGSPQDESQLKKLPDDGGFGVGNASDDQDDIEDSSNSNLLSPEGSNDTIFSFSRGEFDDSGVRKPVRNQQEIPSEEEGVSGNESSKSPVEFSTAPSSPDDIISEAKQNQDGLENEASQSGYQVGKPSKISATEAETMTDGTVEEVSKSNVEMEAPESSQLKSNGTKVSKSSPFVEASEDTILRLDNQKHAKDGTELAKVPLNNDIMPGALFESVSKEKQKEQNKKLPDSRDEEQDEGPFERKAEEQDEVLPDTRDQAGEKNLETFQESIDLVEGDTTSRHVGESQHVDERHVTYSRETDPKKDDTSQPAAPIISTESTSDSSHSNTDSESRTSSDEQFVTHPYSKSTAIAEESKLMTAEQNTTSYSEGLKESEQSNPVESVEDQLRTARELIKKARTRGLAVKQADRLFQKATKKLENALEQAEDRTEVAAELGGCLLAWAKTNIADPLSQERLLRALEFLTSTVELQADNETVLFNTGLCLCLVASTSNMEGALGNYQKACDMYEKLLDLNGNSRMACFNCGLAYVSLGRLSLGNESDEKSRAYFERASDLFQRSLELKPGDSKAISYLDDCRRQLRGLEAL